MEGANWLLLCMYLQRIKSHLIGATNRGLAVSLASGIWWNTFFFFFFSFVRHGPCLSLLNARVTRSVPACPTVLFFFLNNGRLYFVFPTTLPSSSWVTAPKLFCGFDLKLRSWGILKDKEWLVQRTYKVL